MINLETDNFADSKKTRPNMINNPSMGMRLMNILVDLG